MKKNPFNILNDSKNELTKSRTALKLTKIELKLSRLKRYFIKEILNPNLTKLNGT